jgi:hypothetical protein
MGEGLKKTQTRGRANGEKPQTDRSCTGPWRDDRGLTPGQRWGVAIRGRWCFGYFRGELVEGISRKLGISRYPT